jgi:hypothetical protein
MAGRIVVALLFCAGFLRAVVYTCSPPPNTPLCQFPEKIRITFIGRVLEAGPEPDLRGGDLAGLNRWYRLSVEEAFTGLHAGEKEIVAWLSLGGGALEVGRTFFVHAEREGNEIRLVSCGDTQPVETAGAEIRYLRERLHGDFRSYIAGSVLRHYKGSQYAIETGLDQPPRGLANAKIKLQGARTSLETLTDAEGRFRLDNVAEGRYSVAVESLGYRLEKPYTIEVPKNGCGIAHVGMFTNAGMSGTVLRSDGKPAQKATVDLIDVDEHYGPPPLEHLYIKTDPGGRFTLANLPSGQFLLGVNIQESSRYPDQTPPSYYPRVASRSEAQVIELKPNEVKTGLVLTLQRPRSFRLVKVHLKWPDGRIPNRGSVDAWVNQGIYLSDYELKNGVFELRLLQGVDYWLFAAALDETHKPTQSARGTWVFTDNYRLSAGDDTVDIYLTAQLPDWQWPKAIYPNSRGAR